MSTTLSMDDDDDDDDDDERLIHDHDPSWNNW